MNKLGNAQDRAMALIGELGDGLRKAVPGKAMQWVETGAALGAVAHGRPGGAEGGAPQPGARGRGDRRRRPALVRRAQARKGSRTGADRRRRGRVETHAKAASAQTAAEDGRCGQLRRDQAAPASGSSITKRGAAALAILVPELATGRDDDLGQRQPGPLDSPPAGSSWVRRWNGLNSWRWRDSGIPPPRSSASSCQ